MCAVARVYYVQAHSQIRAYKDLIMSEDTGGKTDSSMVKACQVEDRLFTNTGSEGAGEESFESRQCSSE